MKSNFWAAVARHTRLASFVLVLVALFGAIPFGHKVLPAPPQQRIGTTTPIFYGDASRFGLYTAQQKATYAAQQNWWVSATGTTTGTGAASNDPITMAELSARLNNVTLTTTGNMTVNIDAAGDAAHSFYITWNTPINTATLIKGTATTVALGGTAGTITTWRNKTPASNITYGITDTGLPAANSWTAQVGRRLRNTTKNTVQWILKDEGSKVARTSPPYTFSDAYPVNVYSGAFNLTQGANADTYVVETLTPLGGIQFVGWEDNSGQIDGNYNARLVVENVSLPFGVVNTSIGVNFLNSEIGLPQFQASSGPANLIGCKFYQTNVYGANIGIFGSTAMGGGMSGAGGGVTLQDVTFQGSGTYFSLFGAWSVYQSGDVAVFDGGGSTAVLLIGNGYWEIAGTNYLYGNGNNYGVRVIGSSFTWGSQKPVITGTTGDLLIEGNAVTWAQTPYNDRLTGAGANAYGTGFGAPLQAWRWSDSGAITVATRFLSAGMGAANATEGNVKFYNAQPTKVANLQVDLGTAPSNTHNTIYRLRKNGVDTALTCTISNVATTCQLLNTSVSFAPGDYVSMSQVPDGAGNVTADPRVIVW
jgi:hypothetical protein